MRRRELITLLGGAAIAWPFAARAQQKAMPVIGYLHLATFGTDVVGIARGLAETGYVEGQNLAIEYRSAGGRYDRLATLAADLTHLKVDVIITNGGTAVALAAKTATATIPIVFLVGGEPVGDGLVASLARPGANLTGATIVTVELMPKRLELLSELLPKAKVIALLVNPGNVLSERMIREVQEAGATKRIRVPILNAGTDGEIDDAYASLARLHPDGLAVCADPFLDSRREQLVALASRLAIPAIYHQREFAAVGGLISYGTNYDSVRRQVGIYAGRILNGEKPADLPVQQPTKFELVINLKTAKALGLAVPESLLARADEVIQ